MQGKGFAARSRPVIAPQQFDTLDPQQMRQALLGLMAEMAAKDELLERQTREVAFKED